MPEETAPTATAPAGSEARPSGLGTENTVDAGYRYDGGLLGLEVKTVDGACRTSRSWARPADRRYFTGGTTAPCVRPRMDGRRHGLLLPR
ncbi:hypothetical protein [Streptomyces sp. NPDC046870]|uniref:hypothetical protein n=1 Tax=Streptomyces sp. NPDC046870 TaxID=3155135 RepID=UPI00345285F1